METRTEIVELTIQLPCGDDRQHSAKDLVQSAWYKLDGRKSLGVMDVISCTMEHKTKRFTVVAYNPDTGERFAHHIVAGSAVDAEHRFMSRFSAPGDLYVAGVFEGFLKGAA